MKKEEEKCSYLDTTYWLLCQGWFTSDQSLLAACHHVPIQLYSTPCGPHCSLATILQLYYCIIVGFCFVLLQPYYNCITVL